MYRVPDRRSTDPSKVLVTESIELDVQVLTGVAKDLFWDDKDQTVETECNFKEMSWCEIHGAKWVYSIAKMPVFPTEAITLVNKVNSDTITSPTLGYVFTPGELLFESPQISGDLYDDGAVAFHWTFRMKMRTVGWNKWPRAGSNFYELAIVYKKGGDRYYANEPAAFKPVLLM